MSQNHFTLSFPLKSPTDAKLLAEQLPPLMPQLIQAADTIGTIHYSRFTVLSEKTLLFLGDFDGEFGQLNPRAALLIRNTEVPVTMFTDPDPFQEFAYLNVLAAKRAIADYLAIPLAKLPPEQLEWINTLVETTLSKKEVIEQVQKYFGRRTERESPC
jgi:hypothetical protein